MAADKKASSAVTVSITDESIVRFDRWRNAQPYAPSRSKVFQTMIDEFLDRKEREQEGPEAKPLAASNSLQGTIEERKTTKGKAAA